MWGSGFMHLDEFELVRSPADNVVGLATTLAAVPEVYPLGRLFTPFGLWPWETSIPRGHLTESSLTPFEF